MKGFLWVVAVALLIPGAVLGDMTSTNYTIYSDAIGVSGGDYASSTNYSITDTFGETPVAYASSTNYTVNAGYQATTRGSLSFSISTTSLSLGTLTTTTVSMASATISITNDLGTYSVSVSSVTGVMPAAVSDGSVTAGSEEYGLSAVGPSSAVSGDVAVTNGLVIANSSTPVIDDTTVLTFKAAAALGSTAGTYSQVVGLTAVSGL